MKLSNRTHSVVQAVKDIVETLEGATDPVECLVNARFCPRFRLCARRDIWGEIKITVDRVFIYATLRDLAEG